VARPTSPHGVSYGRFLRDLCLVLAVCGVIVWGVTRWVVIPWVVAGPSMEPTLTEGDRVLVDLWTLRRRLPRPGDIVVASGPGDEDLVKRIAPEPYPGNDPYPVAVLPSESPLEPTFVVLGDNPAASNDSRRFGRLPRHRIRGRVAWRYWPLSRWGSIE
jgi:signal peptidase I